jgi:hypothetical protein
MKKQATYRMVKFIMADQSARYVGIAWNYDQAVLISTKDYDSYTQARAELTSTCDSMGVELAWFDGEYERKPGDDAMYPVLK